MSARRFGAVAAVLLLAACNSTPQDPHARMYGELADAYRPYSDCIREALQSRSDFDGKLAEMAIAKGLDGRVQELHRRYLGSAVDLAALAPEARVIATREAIVALGAFGSAVDPVGAPPELKVKRMMAVIESMHLISDAAGTTCAYPENLQSGMKEAENEYL